MGTTYSKGHVGLNVTGLARSTDFYREVFGFDLAEQGLSFEVPTIDDVRAAETHLGAMDAQFACDGVVPHEASSDSGGSFFADPDGSRLEIYAPTGAGLRPAPHSHAPTCSFF